MKNCSIEWCSSKYYAKWYCCIHYNRATRWVNKNPLNSKGHHNRWIEKLWENINKEWTSITNIWTPCWIWNWHKINGWYWIVFINWISERTHCLSWKIHNKKEIEVWMQICHKCDTPSCCNPEHLFLWTAKDNTQDKVKKWRCYTGDHKWELSWRSKLTEKQVLEIRIDNRSNRKIAIDYNIDYSSVSDIKRRKTWKHI